MRGNQPTTLWVLRALLLFLALLAVRFNPATEATLPQLARWVVVAPILSLALMLPGCEDPTLGRGITVRNETEASLTFQGLLNGEVVPLPARVGPNDTVIVIDAAALGEHSRVGEDGCTTVPVIALGPNGEEVARAEPPLCVGDEWVVEGPSE